jgi:cysteine synthase
MIWAAERAGILRPGSRQVTIVEPTSGNTGRKGYHTVIMMPKTVSDMMPKTVSDFGSTPEEIFVWAGYSP